MESNLGGFDIRFFLDGGTGKQKGIGRVEGARFFVGSGEGRGWGMDTRVAFVLAVGRSL